MHRPRLFQNFSFRFYFFENALKLQKCSIFSKKKSLHKYCPAAIGTALSPNFVFDAKVQNSAFLNVSFLGV